MIRTPKIFPLNTVPLNGSITVAGTRGQGNMGKGNTLFDVLVCSIVEYFCELAGQVKTQTTAEYSDTTQQSIY